MLCQVEPESVERCQAYVTVPVGDQVPAFAVKVWPSSAVPVIVGALLFAGGEGTTGPSNSEAADVRPALPASSVTSTRTYWPASPPVSV